MSDAPPLPGVPARAAYVELEERFRRIALVREASEVLQWDMAAVMPPGGAAVRGDQLANLREIAHGMLTAPELPDLFAGAAEAGAKGDLDAWQAPNLREMRRQWLYATAIPRDLVGRHSRTASACEMAWRTCRDTNDFPGILPQIRMLLELTREIAAARAAAFGVSPYDALLDEFEPGGSSAEIDRTFAELARRLPDLIARVIERQAREAPAAAPVGDFPEPAQRALAEGVMAALGFDFAHGRLDTSHHPFCGGVPEDVRITTRWSRTDFLRGLMAVLHETGHALYERGLPAKWRRQPVGLARGMSIHESQSILIEMQACRSREFLEFLAPRAAEALGGRGPEWTPESLYRSITSVSRSLIRVDADEVTYPAHVILRYRLERALIAGDLALEDLPGAWRDGMRELVGIEPSNDREGCLQDIHWFSGAFGYFPTYTLGAMTAAQLFATARRDVPEIPSAIARGDFAPLRTWLGERVHAQGSRLPTPDLVRSATGRALDATVFLEHLERRYLA